MRTEPAPGGSLRQCTVYAACGCAVLDSMLPPEAAAADEYTLAAVRRHEEQCDADLRVREVAPEVPQVRQAAPWPPSRDIIVPASEAEREAVRRAQRALRLVPTGDMDEATLASLRGTQALFKLPVTGVLDRATAQALGRLAYTPPED